MPLDAIYPRRSSLFGLYHRSLVRRRAEFGRGAFNYALTDIDGFRVTPRGESLIEHRTGGYRSPASDGTLHAVARLATRVGFGFDVVKDFQRFDVDTRQQLWLAYRTFGDDAGPVAVFWTVGNTWPWDANRPLWRGENELLVDTWTRIESRVRATGITTQILSCREPFFDDNWLAYL